MHTVTLSGWGQPHDALSVIAPNSHAIDYAHAASVEAAFHLIAEEAKAAERIIGWSLGGQLAVRAIAGGYIAPKQLVLIATPYQFMMQDALAIGMGRQTFGQFRDNFEKNARRTLNKAWELIHHNDIRTDYIELHMRAFDKDAVLKKDWLRWLDILKDFSCETLDFTSFPNTLLIHGEEDVVVEKNQSQQLARRITGATLQLWEGCGHAPHFHDAARLVKAINDHV